MRKKKKIISFFVSIIFTFIFSLYILPNIVNFVLNYKNDIPIDLKKEILTSGKKYIKKNNVEFVNLKDLEKGGYIIFDDEFDKLNCHKTLSNVNKYDKIYSLNLQCAEERATLTLLDD